VALVDMGAWVALAEAEVVAAARSGDLVGTVGTVGTVVNAEATVLDQRSGMSMGRVASSSPRSCSHHSPSTNGTCGRQHSRQSRFAEPCTKQGIYRQSSPSKAFAPAQMAAREAREASTEARTEAAAEAVREAGATAVPVALAAVRCPSISSNLSVFQQDRSPSR
jgi:hypothetical protein